MRIQAKDGRVLIVPHRDIHDIRAQIMAEDATPEDSADGSPVIGLSTDDITPTIYEGGYKTWECSEDLAAYTFSMLDASHSNMDTEHHFIEVSVVCTSFGASALLILRSSSAGGRDCLADLCSPTLLSYRPASSLVFDPSVVFRL